MSAPAATTATPLTANNTKGLVGGAILAVAVLFALYFGYQQYLESKKEAEVRTQIQQAERQKAMQATLDERQARSGSLRYDHDCFTPCSFQAKWPYELHGGGYDLEVRPEGGEPFKYPGRGNDPFKQPTVKRGTRLYLTSLDSNVDRVRVLIYERIK